MLRHHLEQATLLNHLSIISEKGQAFGMDKFLQLQPAKSLARVSVHLCRRGVGGQHPTGLQVSDQHPITGGFKDVPIQLFGFRNSSIHDEI